MKSSIRTILSACACIALAGALLLPATIRSAAASAADGGEIAQTNSEAGAETQTGSGSATETSSEQQATQTATSGETETQTDATGAATTADDAVTSSAAGATVAQVEASSTASETQAAETQSAAGTPAASTSPQSVADGIYTIESLADPSLVIDIVGGSKDPRAYAQLYVDNQSDAQKYKITYGSDGWYTIENIKSGLVLDAKGGGTVSGTAVWQYGANGTDAQKWSIADNGDGTVSIANKKSGLVFSVSGGDAARRAKICLDSPSNASIQKFSLVSTQANSDFLGAGDSGRDFIVSSALDSSMVLDIAAGSGANDANLQLYRDNGTNAQKFHFAYVGEGCYSISCLGTGLALDVDHAGTQLGTNVRQHFANGTDAQTWRVVPNADGTYSFISLCSYLRLDVAGASTDLRTNIQTWRGNGTAAQRFSLAETHVAASIDDGIYAISSVCDLGTCLDVAGGSTQAGANVQLYRYNYSRAQRWNFKWNATSEGGYYTVASIKSGLLLEVAGDGTAPGSNVQLGADDGSAAQHWTMRKADGDGHWSLVSAANGLILDLSAGVTDNGTNIQVWSSNHATPQAFEVAPIRALADGATYVLYSAAGSKQVLDISGGSAEENANLQTYAFNGSLAQLYKISDAGSGYCSISPWCSEKFLDVEMGYAVSGTNVRQHTGNGASAQKWAIRDAGNGFYSIGSAVGDNLYLAVSGGKASSGANVDIENGTGASSAQEFEIISVPEPDITPKWDGHGYIMVNRECNVVTIYNSDGTPVKAMVCSTGIGYATPHGTYNTIERYRWRALYGGVYGQYATRIVGAILFHSVPYTSPDIYSLEWWEYNKLGEQASMGCIRLSVADAKWIYDNCSIGIQVTIYDSPDPGPLGKPQAAKLPAGQGWDPTDPEI